MKYILKTFCLIIFQNFKAYREHLRDNKLSMQEDNQNYCNINTSNILKYYYLDIYIDPEMSLEDKINTSYFLSVKSIFKINTF